jgi:hypothetical protein
VSCESGLYERFCSATPHVRGKMGTRIVRIMRIFADHLVALRPLLFDIL